jgi:secreted PhoX family phosphatase
MKTRDLLKTLSVESDIEARRSMGTPFDAILRARLSRRDTLRGGLGLAAATFFAGTGLSACGGGSRASEATVLGGGTVTSRLTFSSIPGSSEDLVTVPDGYEIQVLIPWGTPIRGSFPDFDDSGATTNTAAEQADQMGMNHDGMFFFGLPDGSSLHGLLCVNHEFSADALYGDAGRDERADGTPTNADQVRKDINAHGVSVVEIHRDDNGVWNTVGGRYNRRITGATPMGLSGPAAGSALLATPYSPAGNATRGTLSNCGSGRTPWGTYLTCEENIQGYFVDRSGSIAPQKRRYGITDDGFGYRWDAVAGDPGETDGEFARFDTTATGVNATDDWRNEANGFGWVVEIDPFDPSSTPMKRTAMGRFRHEGAASNPVVGRRIAFYMGDDARFEYFYKFVTDDAWNPDNPVPDMLDRGTLYAARLDADGRGEWLPLDIDRSPALRAAFGSQAEVLVYSRSAADALGATPMDRPEWATVDPFTDEVYFTLTNNTDRSSRGVGNPRAPNFHGHILRLHEDAGAPDATAFSWDIFVFGSPASADPDYNRSGLTLANEFGSPDGLWVDPRGVLWIQTDNSAPLDSGSNDQMLAVIPADLPGERLVTPESQGDLRRFFVGPVGCEITGIDITPDYRTLFVNVQHPQGHWPGGGNSLPRSATVVVRRTDRGPIAL